MIYTEQEFYSLLYIEIKKDLKEKGLNSQSILKKPYLVSRTQIYNIKEVSKGSNKTSRLSHKRLIGLCNYLGINLKDVKFETD